MWMHKLTTGIGGLEDVGFAINSEELIVLSSQGVGVFNCSIKVINLFYQFNLLVSLANL
jgi:hypothetical protein